jgi:parallel beta-helix repeat protein
MSRSVSPLLVLVFSFLILNSLLMVVQAPADDPVVTTQRSDYFIGERVEAKMIMTYTGNPGNINWSVEFEWEDPMGGLIFNETLMMTVYTDDNYGAAFSNWTSDLTGNGFTVRGIHTSEAKFFEANFNVSTYEEIAVVESLSVSISRPFYENNTVARATTTMGYLGNGTKLGNVTIEWRYPNSTLAFTENKTSPDGGPNGTSVVDSFWAVDFVGTGFEVQATYTGIQPLTDTAAFDVIPERVRTWKNASISANVLWAESDSPFGVCDNITVQQGSTLTVEAGSVIRFCPDTGIIVRGALVMDGFPTSKINLTSFSYPSNRGDWKGVNFEPESDDSGSLLNQVIIEYSQIGLMLDQASPTVTNMSVANSSVSGIEVHQSYVHIIGAKVMDSGRGIYAVDSTLYLRDSEILGCDDGVQMEDSNGTLQTNWIHDNTNRGIWLVRSNPLVWSNTIQSNTNEGVRIDNSMDVLLAENTISGSAIGFYGFQSTGLTLKENRISKAGSVGVAAWTSNEVLVENSTIASSPTSIRVTAGSEVTTLNSTFDDDAVIVTAGKLYIDNYLHVRVMDTIGSPLEDASVTLTVDGVPGLIGYSRQDGWLNWSIVRYEAFVNINRTYTQVALEVDLDGFNITDSPRSVNMSLSHAETFQGQRMDILPDGGGVDAFLLIILGIIGGVIASLAVILFILPKRRKKDEEPEEEPGVLEFNLEEGKAYIITQDGAGRSFERFVSEMEDGAAGLCFTRTYPENLKKRYNLENAKVLWLSRDLDKGGLMPTNLGLITNGVDKFLRENEDGRRVILLDGMEYLIAQNNFGKVLKLLNHLNDMVGVNSGILMIPFDMASVEEKEAAMLKANLEVV